MVDRVGDKTGICVRGNMLGLDRMLDWRSGLFGSYNVKHSSPDSVSTLRGSDGRCEGWCLIRVVTLFCDLLPVNFRKNRRVWNLDMRFDCAGSRKVCVRVLGIFHVNFRMKWPLWDHDMRFDLTVSHKVWSAGLVFHFIHFTHFCTSDSSQY